jgi:hypothetical protein
VADIRCLPSVDTKIAEKKKEEKPPNGRFCSPEFLSSPKNGLATEDVSDAVSKNEAGKIERPKKKLSSR